MKITYLGHSCFFIKGTKSVVTDPFMNIGYDMERVSADYVLVSHNHFDHNGVTKVDAKQVILGENDLPLGKDINLSAIKTFHDNFKGRLRGENLVYKFTIDGVTFVHLGDLGEDFTEETANLIGSCDILFVPIGGNYTIDYIEAKKYVDKINPKIVVPMHFKTPRSNIDIDGAQKFLSLFKNVKIIYKDLDLDMVVNKDNDLTVCLFDDSCF